MDGTVELFTPLILSVKFLVDIGKVGSPTASPRSNTRKGPVHFETSSPLSDAVEPTQDEMRKGEIYDSINDDIISS